MVVVKRAVTSLYLQAVVVKRAVVAVCLHQVAVMTKAVVAVCLHQVAVERWWTTLMRIRRCAK